MSTHLYNSRLGRIRWFIRRFGVSELWLKPIRMAFAPLILPLLPRNTFRYRDRELPLFHHRYNITWSNERAVEVPVAREHLTAVSPDSALEIGNVLSHYGPVRHAVLDKFEKGPNLINADITDFHPERRFALILSISTFEHVGFDDEPDEAGEKILAAIANCRSLLAPEGRLIFTVPIGYNPKLDALVRENRLDTANSEFLLRSGRHRWEGCDRETALRHPYRARFPYANAVLIGTVTHS